MSNVFFTADTHFGHANIIRYCNRPWCTEEDLTDDGEWVSRSVARLRCDKMDEDLIKQWNAVVSPRDIVYHLGDFCMGTSVNAFNYLRRLNFKVLYYIWGNHDAAIRGLNVRGFAQQEGRNIIPLGKLEEVNVNNQRITLCHYAMRVWNRSHHGAWHLFGHSHGNLAKDINSFSMDVGVDAVPSFQPISYADVAREMATRKFVPVDHHGE
jgi:calcineurin-like phosphoesterase family protein